MQQNLVSYHIYIACIYILLIENCQRILLGKYRYCSRRINHYVPRDISILIFIHAMRSILASQKFITNDRWMMATTYLITPGAYTFAAVAIYGCTSGATGNGRRTRRWAMLRSVERRRGASDENELFGCRLSFRDRETDTNLQGRRETDPWIDDRREKTREMKKPEATVFVLSPAI